MNGGQLVLICITSRWGVILWCRMLYFIQCLQLMFWVYWLSDVRTISCCFLKMVRLVLFHLQKEEITFCMCPALCACKFISTFLLKTMKIVVFWCAVRKVNICWYLERDNVRMRKQLLWFNFAAVLWVFLWECECDYECGGVANKTHPITLNKLSNVSCFCCCSCYCSCFCFFTRLLSNICWLFLYEYRNSVDVHSLFGGGSFSSQRI